MRCILIRDNKLYFVTSTYWLLPLTSLRARVEGYVDPPIHFCRIGSFSIDDGNGSENVSFKMNSRFFNLCRVYSNLLNMASVGEFPRS